MMDQFLLVTDGNYMGLTRSHRLATIHEKNLTD